MGKYANIIVNISHENLDRTFQYQIPERLQGVLMVGDYVKIPFGKGNRTINGYVLEITDEAEYDPLKMKCVESIEKNNSLVEGRLIRLAKWMKETYGSTMITALKTVLPIKKEVKAKESRNIQLVMSQEDAGEQLALYEKKHQTARARLLAELIKEKNLDYKIVTQKLNIQSATIRLLEEQGVLKVEAKRVYRNTAHGELSYEKCILNEMQKKVADEIKADLDAGIHQTYLLKGVTGSGKTEVYMEVIEHVVRNGGQAIVLIPEIALTYQTVMRFYKRFGDRVSTLHSKLSDGERYDQFERAKKGEIDVMIGPRSALFTPFENLGIVIIDEEHETSYKSDSMPKYHARDVAEKLCELYGASLILGSATPSIEAYYRAKNGIYKLHELPARANGAQMARVEVVDLREELKRGNKSIFSGALKSGIEDRLTKGEQVMLFLNRRGYAGFISCRACGEAVKCPHCDVSLSRHINKKLVCHYCGYEQKEVTVCPHCGSTMIGEMKAGTEKIEELVKKSFPYAKVLRMDADTTKQKGGYETILSAFANREADILVGTQMIVKGHDFPYVTLVGILAADMSLNVGDYRCAERTFQLLTQAAGRAGRGNRAGEVVIQTYNPEHYSIVNAAKQNYESYYQEEMAYRSLMDYPPAGHMVAILIEGRDSKSAIDLSTYLAETIKNVILKDSTVRMIGPTDAAVRKINDIYRRILYLKSKDYERLTVIKDLIEAMLLEKSKEACRVTFDFDPLNGY